MKNEFCFYHTFRTRFSEVDSHGHVFNANYYVYFDTAISEYFRHLELNEIFKIKDNTYNFHVVKTSAEFHAPVFDDVIDVYVRISKLGTSSLVFDLEIYKKNEEDLCCKGEVIWVNTYVEKRQKQSLPEAFKETIRAFEKSNYAG